MEGKNIENPLNFKDASIVTTFVSSAVNCTLKMWRILESGSKTELGVRLEELEHPSLKKISRFCSGLALIYVHPSFFRTSNLMSPLDVGGLIRDGRVTTEVGTGSLEHTIGILTPKDFETVMSTE